jgi:hypothetical protein
LGNTEAQPEHLIHKPSKHFAKEMGISKETKNSNKIIYTMALKNYKYALFAAM